MAKKKPEEMTRKGLKGALTKLGIHFDKSISDDELLAMYKEALGETGKIDHPHEAPELDGVDLDHENGMSSDDDIAGDGEALDELVYSGDDILTDDELDIKMKEDSPTPVEIPCRPRQASMIECMRQLKGQRFDGK